MTPQRYQQINSVADAALEIPPEQRGAFLEEACAGDADLRRQVQDLLDAHTSEHVFLDAPALELLARDMAASPRGTDLAGKQIQQYKVVSRLGAGGVGEVWLARDTRLTRDVALKLLSPRFAGDSSHVRRLEREARAASTLNHPNIVTIYEVGEFDGVNFIAQEFVRGETLRQRLLNGPLPVASVLDIGSQAAGALAAAHGAGIVHRDIKPENLMIRPDGLVKVLDFGLARFVEQQGAAEGALSRSHSITRPGMVIGTVRYMSPEQARGLKVDARSDIFSLGVVLYELLAGTPPFHGPTPTDTVAAILAQEPQPLTKYLTSAPPALEPIVRRCLEKNPEARYANAHDLKTDLGRLARRLEFPDQPTPPDERPPLVAPRKRSLATIFSTVGLAAALLAVAFYAMSGRREETPAFSSMKISRVSTRGDVSDAALSSDAKYVAYVMNEARGESVWITQLATGADRRLLPAELGRHDGLTFSADGNYLYYRRRGREDIAALYRLAVNGGAPARLMESITDAIAFAPDGRHFAFIRVDPALRETRLTMANADGTGERVIATRRRPYYFSRYGLAWSPDGRDIACFGGHAEAYTMEAFHLIEVRVEDGVEKTITKRAWKWAGPVAWANGGRIFFSGTEQLDDVYQIWMVTMPRGDVARLTNDLNNYSRLSIASDGKTILALEAQKYADIWVAPAGGVSRAAQATFGSIHGLNSVTWTPDGNILYSALAGEYRNIWMMDANGRNLKQLTSTPGNKDELAMTRDGRYILYQSNGNIWRADPDGGNPLQLTHGAMDVHPTSSADSQTVVFASFIDWSPGMAGKPTLWKVPIDGGKPMPVSQEPASIPQVSSDGRVIACEYFPGVEPQLSHHLIATMSYQEGTVAHVFENLPVSFSDLRWAPDGRAITFAVNTGEAGNVWRQPLGGGAAVPVTEFHADEIFTYAWSREGKLALARGKRVNDVVLLRSASD